MRRNDGRRGRGSRMPSLMVAAQGVKGDRYDARRGNSRVSADRLAETELDMHSNAFDAFTQQASRINSNYVASGY